jgi:protoporphyrin/coproporphyrin ferrochelatase
MTTAPPLPGDVGVVLLNMGGPSSEDEVGPFLRELFDDPAILGVPWPVRPALGAWISWRRAPHAKERYRRLGGRSVLLDACREQAEALRLRLSCPVREVMRYRQPDAKSVLNELVEQGVSRLVALPLYPQYSTTTTATSLADLRAAADARGMEVAEVRSYPTHPGLVAALADGLRGALAELPALGDTRLHLLLTAHGIPVSRVRRGDTYPEEVAATAAAVAATVDPPLDWSLAYQSRVGPARWLEPSIEDEVSRLAAEGVRALVVQPLTFTSENLETLDDLDRELAEHARGLHISLFRRGAAPGIHPLYIGALAELATVAATDAGWMTS